MERGFPLSAPFAKAAHAGALTQYRLPLIPKTAEFGSAPPLFWRHADFDEAFIDGRKSPQHYLKVPAHNRPGCATCHGFGWVSTRHRLRCRISSGDLLWVKEPYAAREGLEPGSARALHYLHYRAEYGNGSLHDEYHEYRGWKPAAAMPRWASRTTLAVASVQVERLHDLTEEDAIANGSQIPCAELPKSCRQATLTERTAFSRIWDATEGKRDPWETNPWVWVLSFTPRGVAV